MKNYMVMDYGYQEFKERMLVTDSEILVEFLGRDFIITDDEGNITGSIDIIAAIDPVIPLS